MLLRLSVLVFFKEGIVAPCSRTNDLSGQLPPRGGMPEPCGEGAKEGASSLLRLCIDTVTILWVISEGRFEFLSSVVERLPRVSLSPVKRTELFGVLYQNTNLLKT